MLRYAVILIFSGSALMAQKPDIVYQVKLIQRVLPGSTRISLVYNPSVNLKNEILQITQETGLSVVKAPISDIRDMNKILRNLERYDVDIIFLVEDRMITSKNGIRTATKFGMKKKIPVFTTSENGFDSGSLGQPYLNGDQWRLRLNGKLLAQYGLQVPQGDSRYAVVN